MDDIDTRLEAERPEVADALRSMNWEERLEQARARRKTVLARNEAAEKRPVVRIIDAAAVARKRADSQPVGPARPASPPVAQADVAPEPKATSPALPAAPAADPAPTRERSSMAGRTALGFGLGLGIGASLVAGAFLMVGLPGSPTVPAETTAMAAHAPAPQRTAPRDDGGCGRSGATWTCAARGGGPAAGPRASGGGHSRRGPASRGRRARSGRTACSRRSGGPYA
jgi:hypothetical protein